MKNKGGRPKSENKFTHEVMCMVKEDLYRTIQQYCKEEEISIAEFLRKSMKAYLRNLGRL